MFCDTALSQEPPEDVLGDFTEESIRRLRAITISRAVTMFEQNQLIQRYDEEERQLEEEFERRREELRQRRCREMDSYVRQMVEGAIREYRLLGYCLFQEHLQPQGTVAPSFPRSAIGAAPEVAPDTTPQGLPSVTLSVTQTQHLHAPTPIAGRMYSGTRQASGFFSNTRAGSSGSPSTRVVSDSTHTSISQIPPSSATLSSPTQAETPNRSPDGLENKKYGS
jgi:hypothetical protein